jgi:hypothetical protein
MDALLQIIVPKLRKIEGLEITQPLYEWDGVEYPQGPKIISWQDISLSFDERTEYCQNFLSPNYLGEDWIWLKFSDETLDRYEILVNDETENNNEKTLETFIRLFLEDIDKWVIVFLLHYDQIDSVYQLNVRDCITKLKNNLNRQTI